MVTGVQGALCLPHPPSHRLPWDEVPVESRVLLAPCRLPCKAHSKRVGGREGAECTRAQRKLGPLGMVPGRRKFGVKNSSVTSAMHGAGPQGSAALTPTRQGHQPHAVRQLQPLLPAGTVTLRSWGASSRGLWCQAPGEGADSGCASAPRIPAWLLGAKLVPSVVPGCPAPWQGHSRSRRVLGRARVQAGQDDPGAPLDPTEDQG